MGHLHYILRIGFNECCPAENFHLTVQRELTLRKVFNLLAERVRDHLVKAREEGLFEFGLHLDELLKLADIVEDV